MLAVLPMEKPGRGCTTARSKRSAFIFLASRQEFIEHLRPMQYYINTSAHAAFLVCDLGASTFLAIRANVTTTQSLKTKLSSDHSTDEYAAPVIIRRFHRLMPSTTDVNHLKISYKMLRLSYGILCINQYPNSFLHSVVSSTEQAI